MRRQRTTLFGKKPRNTPKKDGSNPPVPERRRAALRVEDLDIRFNNDTATQFGGYPLWHAYATEIGLDAKLAQHLKLTRGANGFTAPEAARFIIDVKLLGFERLMHVESARLDPMLTACAGIEGLPSGKTLGAFLKEHTPAHVEALDRLNVRLNAEQWAAWREDRGVTGEMGVGIDYDSSTFTVYGKQEGADRGRCFRKKDKPGFQPRFGFQAGLGIILHHELCPQSHNLNRDFLAFHEETVRKLPRGARLDFVRGDTGIYSFGNIRAFELRTLTYGISAPMTPHFSEALRALRKEDWEEGVDPEGRPYSIARIRYCPATWDGRMRTYIVSRRLRDTNGQRSLFEGGEYKYFGYVTNRKGKLLDQFRFCTERCSLESFIKEAKLGLHYDRLPCGRLTANRAYLEYVRMAYNLGIYFKLRRAPRTVNRWTLNTLRSRLLVVCGNLRRRAKRWVLSLPRWWPYQTVFRQIARTCLPAAAT